MNGYSHESTTVAPSNLEESLHKPFPARTDEQPIGHLDVKEEDLKKVVPKLTERHVAKMSPDFYEKGKKY